ncbi:MAG: DUF2520 domain-containing protein [Ignavibacteria bacterium]|nr:DUF2520 domain-containing protein [Ignavibacteria bacterium]
MRSLNIHIIGFGKVGSALAYELYGNGFEVSYITDRHADDYADVDHELRETKFQSELTADSVMQSDVLIFCVQDRNIEDAAKEAVRLCGDVRGKYFIHTSGSRTSRVFIEAGAEPDYCASLHPIQTFAEVSRSSGTLLKNIYFGIEGGEKGLDYAGSLAESFGSKCIIIPGDKKHLYHAACVVASNFLVTLMNIAAEFSSEAGIPKAEMYTVFKPIVERTLDNIERDGLVNSLTGPFERNDIQTIAGHLDSISGELPSLIPFYTLLGMETVRVAFRKESLNMKNVISILDLMNDYVTGEQKLSEQLSKE